MTKFGQQCFSHARRKQDLTRKNNEVKHQTSQTLYKNEGTIKKTQENNIYDWI
jgi:hypothetical protein